ncbi:hypothetical protein AB205_0050610 [Aquarana catesbeiana]|uniref:Uncharacterized protein n=1 Tax=Aquarana catesbeiana TaxID=8400 RepID=A0A2G9S1J8_AQUCT|nr:hypothetical protein AB205_0050610 [Aquarana catesbeiana]
MGDLTSTVFDMLNFVSSCNIFLLCFKKNPVVKHKFVNKKYF